MSSSRILIWLNPCRRSSVRPVVLAHPPAQHLPCQLLVLLLADFLVPWRHLPPAVEHWFCAAQLQLHLLHLAPPQFLHCEGEALPVPSQQLLHGILPFLAHCFPYHPALLLHLLAAPRSPRLCLHSSLLFFLPPAHDRLSPHPLHQPPQHVAVHCIPQSPPPVRLTRPGCIFSVPHSQLPLECRGLLPSPPPMIIHHPRTRLPCFPFVPCCPHICHQSGQGSPLLPHLVALLMPAVALATHWRWGTSWRQDVLHLPLCCSLYPLYLCLQLHGRDHILPIHSEPVRTRPHSGRITAHPFSQLPPDSVPHQSDPLPAISL
ncbi:unnamed protein product [Closterium sp. NIES-53]